MPDENIALIRFVPGFVEAGVCEDGLPRFKPVVKIIKSVPPYTQVEYVATEADFAAFPGPYALFQKQYAATKLMPSEGGFPLALWPVCTLAELQMLAARDIVTIEQLVSAPLAGMPGDLRELVDRAKLMLDLSSEIGKFEAIMRQKDGVIEVLSGQVSSLRATVTAQEGMLANLQQKAA